MITTSTPFATNAAKRQKRPLWLVEIDTYPYSFTNRKGLTFPDPATPSYTIVEGPFASADGWGTGSYFNPTTNKLQWIGYRFNPDAAHANQLTVYGLRNGSLDYLEFDSVGLGSNAGLIGSNSGLQFDGTYYYTTAFGGPGTAKVCQINSDGSIESTYGSTGLISPLDSSVTNGLFVGRNIGGSVGVLWANDGGKITLLRPTPLTNITDITLGSGIVRAVFDRFGSTWAVWQGASSAKVSNIDWDTSTSTDYAITLSGNLKAALYIQADESVIIATATHIYKFDLLSQTITNSMSFSYAGMSRELGSDGLIIMGINKFNPVTFTLATNLDISGFGIAAGFSSGGSDTYDFGRPYDSARDIFWAEDLDGNVWGLRLSVPGSTIRPWLKPSPEDIELTIDELNGSSSLGQLVFDVLDDPAPANTSQHRLTVDMATFTFEGKRIWLKTGYVGMNRADLLTCFTGVIDSVDSTDGNTGYTFTCSGGMIKLDNVVYGTGDDGQPTDSDHPRTITGHPIDILLDLLINELSLSTNDFDGDTLRAYRDSVFAGMKFKFSITQSPAARDWIEKQIMTPLGGVMWENNLGVLKFNFMWPLNGTSSVMTLTKADLSKTPTAGQTDLVNTISYRFDKDDSNSGSGKFLSERVEKYDPSLVKYQNLPGQHIVESDGVRAAFQGNLIASLVSRLVFLRYGLKNLTFEAEGQWKMLPLEPFDLILVTHPLVPDRVNGVFGITNWLLQVFDRKWLLSENKVQLRVVDASALLKYGQFKIAPDGTPTWTSASTYEKGRYMFYSGVTGKMSDGATAATFG